MNAPDFRLPPPPPQAVSFRTDALDEVRAFVARADGEHSRVVHGCGPLAYERHVLFGSEVALAWNRVGLGQTIRGTVRDPVLHLSLDAGSAYLFGRKRASVAPRSAMFIAPGWEFTRRSEPGSVVALSAGLPALTAEIDARRPEVEGAWSPRSRPVDLHGGGKEALESVIADLATPMHCDRSRHRRDHDEARAISVLATLLMRGTVVSRSPPLARSRLANVESWIEAHLGEPITLGRLCRVAGVGDRSLQLAFASLRGVSPMRFVAERRLAEARRRLLRADADTDVTCIAIAAGFSHLSRFAATYRQAYGESPSDTLRDAAQPRACRS